MSLAFWTALFGLGLAFVALDQARHGIRPPARSPAGREAAPPPPGPGRPRTPAEEAAEMHETPDPTMRADPPPRPAESRCPTGFSGAGAYGAPPGTPGVAGPRGG